MHYQASLSDGEAELQPASLSKESEREVIVREWFSCHDNDVPRQGKAAVALLSCLFPHKRADRV